MVSLTLSRMLCGSVQINDASTSLVLVRPRTFLIHSDSSSLLSSSHCSQYLGGCRNRPQPLQRVTEHCLVMPSVMSTWVRRQFTHMLVGLDGIDAPQRQHSM